MTNPRIFTVACLVLAIIALLASIDGVECKGRHKKVGGHHRQRGSRGKQGGGGGGKEGGSVGGGKQGGGVGGGNQGGAGGGGGAIFDVTKFGAKPDGRTDNALAFIKAWNAACKSGGPARLLIPRGNFLCGEVILSGPCTSHMTIDIQGTLLASDDISLYTNGAWIMIEKVNGVLVTGGGTLNGRGENAWEYADGGPSLPVSLVFQTVQNGQMYGLNFVNSMGFHSKITDSNDVAFWNLKFTAPENSPNTDGVHLSSSVNVNVTDCVIATGDDCVSIGHGTYNILIARIFCGPGHGLSVGSLGKRADETNLKGITVINCTLTGTTNGARIKTYRDSPQLQASAIYFQDLVMNRVGNPVLIDQNYNSNKNKAQSRVKLSDVHFRNIWGSTTSKVPISLECSSAFPCEGVELSNINLTPAGNIGPLTSECSNAKFSVQGKMNPAGPSFCSSSS